MIRKIKTSVNGISRDEKYNNENSNGNKMASYDTESRNAMVEEFDLSAYGSDGNMSTPPVTEDVVMGAIEQNFSSNRELTNQMNNQVFNNLKDKIASYMKNNGGSF